MRKLGLLLGVLLFAACGDNSQTGQDASVDLRASTGDLASCSGGPLSACGHPCDTGNSLGIGQYCTNDGPSCGSGLICSAIVNGSTPSPDDTYFCTRPCNPSNSNDCGENVSCQCMGGQCGCTPNKCLGTPVDGGGHD